MRAITFLSTAAILALLAAPALAEDGPLRGRADTGLKLGTERSLVGTEFWVPLTQGRDRVLYTDLRLMRDDQDNFEGNLGFGYRQIVGNTVLGGHGWIDRRHTDLGSTFHQATLGLEALGRDLDFRANGYVPLSDDKIYGATGEAVGTPYLLNSGVFYDTNGFRREVPLGGLDLELGARVPLFTDHVDSIRAYAGAYHFSGEDVEDVTGFRARISADVTPWLALGARFQKDGERGSQGFLEATFRLPGKASFRTSGLRARLDESPERDVDIVTKAVEVPGATQQPVLNETGNPQRVLHVDNSAAGGGDGTLDTPYNTLAAAEAAMQPYDVIYVRAGDGTTAGQNLGITIDEPGVSLIGSGVNLVYDGTRVTGAASGGTVLASATAAPVITNNQVNGDGVTVIDDNAFLSGFTVNGAQRYGVYALSDAGTARTGLFLENLSVTNSGEDGIRVAADGAGSSIEADIASVTASGNKNGIRFYASDDASVTGSLETSDIAANDQHGVIVYDDSTAGSVAADLGGGTRSAGLNALHGNTLEDLAVDVDGATLTAQNNWWGQAAGPDQDDPSVGIRPQIYYGAPIEDGLVGHWTLDSEWTTNTTAYDRSGNGLDGDLKDDLDLTNLVAGQWGESLVFEGFGTSGVDIGTSALLNPADFTILSWYNVVDPTYIYNYIYSNARDVFVPHNGIDFAVSGNNGEYLKVWDSTDAFVFSGIAPPASTWTHTAAVFDGTVEALYRNAVPVGSIVPTNAAPGTPASFSTHLGSMGFNTGDLYTLNGKLDDIRIYDRAMGSDEIAEIYRQNTSSSVNTSGFLSSAP
jgi:hypothetical protein